jgi:fructokinase
MTFEHRFGCSVDAVGAVAGHIPARPVVIGTGLIALDVVYGLDATHLPQLSAGGTCGNVLAALAYLGWTSYPIARLGTDAAGARVLADLESFAVRTDYASLTPHAPTPIVIQRIRIDFEGRVVHTFSLRCPGCRAFFPRYSPVPRSSMQSTFSDFPLANVVFVDRLSAGAIAMAEAKYQQGALIYFEPSANCSPDLFKRMLAVTHILKYSDDSTHRFKSGRSRRALAPLEVETLGAAGVRYRGTMFSGSERWRSVPGFAVPQLRDTAGAGDWLTAGFLDFVAQAGAEGFEALPRDLVEEGLRMGQAFSAWACGFEGPRGGMYRQTVEEVRRMVERAVSGGVLEDVGPAAAPCEPDGILGEVCEACGSTNARQAGTAYRLAR